MRIVGLATVLGAVALTSVPALAAPAEGGGPEVIDVVAPPGRAVHPDLNLRLDKMDYNLRTQDLRFPSGLRVMFQRDPSVPVVAITAVTDHGSSDDPQGREGIAHLVEHLWFRSEHGDLPKTWDLLESEMGCDLNAFTQYDITAYMTVCASYNLPALLKLESLRMSDTIASVTEDMVTTEIEVVRNEIRMRSENFNIPFFTVWEFVNKHMFPEGHPYHRPIAGDHTTIRNCKLADIQKFTEDYYRPENTTIAVVGDIPSSDFAYLLDLMVRTFDLTLLDPDLTADMLRPYPKKEGADPKNPDDWYLVPMDPKNPNNPLPIEVKFPPRKAAFDGLVPPDPVTTDLGVYEGPVKDPTVAVSWTLPAGYQGLDTQMQVMGGILSSFVGQGLEHPDLKEFGGCGALPSKRSTTVVCTATMKKKDGDAASIADRMVDQVAELINPESTSFAGADILEYQLTMARLQFMTQILNSVDLYAAVGAGRATDMSQYAHFTGDADFVSKSLNEVLKLKAYQMRELADQWLKRSRASAVLIRPMERDEVAILSEDTKGSGGHFRGGGEGSILHPSIDPDQITPAFLRELIALPDTSAITDFKLPNGLRVVIMPHGEAPLVNVHLLVGGGSIMDNDGLASLARSFTTDEGPDPLRLAGGYTDRVMDTAEYMGIRGFAANLDGLLWMLREKVETTRPYLSGKPDWVNRKRKDIKKNWTDRDWNIRDVRNAHVNPGHPLYDSIDWEDLEVLKKASPKTTGAILNAKLQPANATLVIVGRVDAAQAKDWAIQYWGGWRSKPGVAVEAQPAVPGPNPAKDFAVYVFDDEGKTQTNVTLACPLQPATKAKSPAHELLGDIGRMTLFTELREQAGVVYSPFAGAFTYPGGSAVMYMTAAIQNDSAVFAAERYLRFLDEAAAGRLGETDLRIKKLSRAAGFAVGQQSIDEMNGMIEDVLVSGEGWDAWQTYANDLADVSLDDLAKVVQGCKDHAFLSFSGPKDEITKQLDDAGMTYTVIDPEERGKEIFEREDPKGYAKYLKDKAKEDAKKAKKGESDEDGDDSEGGDE